MKVLISKIKQLVFVSISLVYASMPMAGVHERVFYIDNTECLKGNPCGANAVKNMFSNMGAMNADYLDAGTLGVLGGDRGGESKFRFQVQPLLGNVFDIMDGSIHDDASKSGSSYYKLDLTRVRLNIKIFPLIFKDSNWSYDWNNFYHEEENYLSTYLRTGWTTVTFPKNYAPGIIQIRFKDDSDLVITPDSSVSTGRNYRALDIPSFWIKWEFAQHSGWSRTQFLYIRELLNNPIRMNDRKCKILVNDQEQKATINFDKVNAGGGKTKLAEKPMTMKINCDGFLIDYPGHQGAHIRIHGSLIDNMISDIEVKATETIEVNGQKKIAMRNDLDKTLSDSIYVEGSFQQNQNCGAYPLLIGNNTQTSKLWENTGAELTSKEYGTIYWRLCQKSSNGNAITPAGDYTGNAKIVFKYY